MFFKKDGLYLFYVCDKAGNYFTKLILLDSTHTSILQGTYIGDEEKSDWVSDDISANNYVDKETILYFGTHKALELPFTDDTASQLLNIQDNSYVYKYDSSLTRVTTRDDVQVFGEIYGNNFYQYLISLSSLIKKPTNNAIIGSQSKDNYYIVTRNNSLDYEKWYEDDNGNIAETSGSLLGNNMGKVKLYTYKDNLRTFSGEAQYIFSVKCSNGVNTPDYYIEMNFDKIQGTFYAYNNVIENKHSITKNAGTNMNFLAFEYNTLSGETSQYYQLTRLSYDYYPFDTNYNPTTSSSYPFASRAELSGVNMLPPTAERIGSSDIMRVNRINVATISGTTATRAGKYVVTRTYKGGTHDLVTDGTTKDDDVVIGDFRYRRTATGEGGAYVILNEGQSNPQLLSLFEFDSITRTYTVYVDRNGIVTKTYMDAVSKTREVGNEITFTLGYKENDYSFFDFFKMMAGGGTLNTSEVPVKINIPYSK